MVDSCDSERGLVCKVLTDRYLPITVSDTAHRKTLQLPVAELEGVAAADVAGFHALFEPAHALGGGAVGEGLFHGVTLGFLLQIIVPDHRGAADGLFQVAVFQRAK